MIEAILNDSKELLTHPREKYKECMAYLRKPNLGLGRLRRFVRMPGGDIIIESIPVEKLVGWNHLHGGYFRRFPLELTKWEKGDFDAFKRLLPSPEFLFEVEEESIRIYKHRDFSA